jgi:hypothetical protein
VESVTHIGTVSVNESPFTSATAHLPRHDRVSAVTVFSDLLCAIADGGSHLDADLAADSGLSIAVESDTAAVVDVWRTCPWDVCATADDREDVLTIEVEFDLLRVCGWVLPLAVVCVPVLVLF